MPDLALAAFARMMDSEREINVMVCEKRPLPIWRTATEAKRDIDMGIAISGLCYRQRPTHMVYASAGDYPTQETLAAIVLSVVKSRPSACAT